MIEHVVQMVVVVYLALLLHTLTMSILTCDGRHTLREGLYDFGTSCLCLLTFRKRPKRFSPGIEAQGPRRLPVDVRQRRVEFVNDTVGFVNKPWGEVVPGEQGVTIQEKQYYEHFPTVIRDPVDTQMGGVVIPGPYQKPVTSDARHRPSWTQEDERHQQQQKVVQAQDEYDAYFGAPLS